MSLREKQLWASLAVGLVIWGAYAVRIAPMLLDLDHPHLARSTGLAFGAALLLFVVAEAALAGAIAWFQRRHRPAQDQALTDAALVAGQVALVVLIALVFLTLAGLWGLCVWAETAYGGGLGLTASSRTLVVVAHLLLAELILVEAVRTVLTLLLVRRR